MATEDSTTAVPEIATTFDEDTLNAIREKLGVQLDEVPSEDVVEIPVQPPPVKRKRGRPRIHPVSETGTTVPELAEEAGVPLPPAKLGKRDEREVSERLANMLVGGTGIASQAKSYLAMTEDEAKAIADPLSSYLVRNAETIPIAQQVLENYDLLAIVLGVLAYTVRIYRDRADELAEQRELRSNANTTTLDRISQSTNPTDNGQEERTNGFISTPYG